MEQKIIKIYPYRWAVLFVFMMVMAAQQLLWITFAPITSIASTYYGVNALSIGLLSVVFMIVYIILSLPASWLIDTLGFRFAVGLGAILTGVFGILRGVFASDYTLVLIFQIGIAIGQPLIINSVTKVAARWFPINERATASGLSWLTGYLGLIVGLVLTPYLVIAKSIPTMLFWYGIFSVVCSIAFICFAKEYPPTPPCSSPKVERFLVYEGLKKVLKKRDFIILMFIFFVGLGVFNGVSTWIEEIIRPRGFSPTQAGILGGLMIMSGVIGSGIVPYLSDKLKNRSRFILIALSGATPGLIGIAFAQNFVLLIISACLLGFFLLSTAPIGFQFGSEIAYPTPEGTATGLLMLMGQISGIIFIFGMDIFRSSVTESMAPGMIGIILLMLIAAFVSSKLHDTSLIKNSN